MTDPDELARWWHLCRLRLLQWHMYPVTLFVFTIRLSRGEIDLEPADEERGR